MRTVWHVYEHNNGKLIGLAGRFRTKAEAKRERQSCLAPKIIKKVRISQTEFDFWASKGYKPRGWRPPLNKEQRDILFIELTKVILQRFFSSLT